MSAVVAPLTPVTTTGEDLDQPLIGSSSRQQQQQQQQQSNNNKTLPEKYTLSFSNLSVHVPGKKKKWYSTIVQPFKYVAQEYLGVSTESRDPLYALNNISGVLPSGQLCLVLGSNDESKSTLLRALSGRLSEQDKQAGTIALNGLPMIESYQGWKRLCPYVSPSDQDHAPVLTVRETFEFARRCTASDDTPNQVIEDDVNELLVSLGLDHVADTVVGDENLRGISGGQKRRVTVGEMILDKNCKYVCLENITDGLSSTDSVKLIQDLANVNFICVFIGYCGVMWGVLLVSILCL